MHTNLYSAKNRENESEAQRITLTHQRQQPEHPTYVSVKAPITLLLARASVSLRICAVRASLVSGGQAGRQYIDSEQMFSWFTSAAPATSARAPNDSRLTRTTRGY